MSRPLNLALFLLLAAAALYANAPRNPVGEKPDFASDRFLVKLTAEANDRAILPEEYNASSGNFRLPGLDAIMAKLKATAVIRAHIRPLDKEWERETGFNRWFIVEVPEGTDILQAVESFRGCAEVEEASPEYYSYPYFVPNDQFYPNNWGHNNTLQLPKYNSATNQHDGAPTGLYGFDSNAQLAWDYSQGFGSSGVVIAIIDTGFDRSHPDLRFVTGYDFGCGDASPDFTYNSAHGTCCAGIAAARGHNGIGVAGIAPGCSVMPLKVTDAWGYISSTAVNNALVYAADHGADVISMSFGSTSSNSYTYYDTSINYAYNKGVPLFAATGNDSASAIGYPAYSQNVISVGAASNNGYRKSTTSVDGEYWWGSNYGSSTQDNRYAIDIMGPTILPTTDIVGGGGYTESNYDLWFNGTSCAAPYVAGVAALLKSRNPSLTPTQVRTALTSTATNMEGGGWDRWTGYGLVNASGALNSVSDGYPFCRITAPDPFRGFTLGSTINVDVNAFDTNTGGSINRVEYYLDGTTNLVYTDTTSPYTWLWNTTGLSVGARSVSVKAVDNSGLAMWTNRTFTLLTTATDGFEATFLTTLPWSTTGDADWAMQSEDIFSGAKAVASGELTEEGETSELSFTLNFTSGGAYSFYGKLVSEVTYDFLRFYIDNALVQEWSGNLNWDDFSGSVTAGVHQFKWIYTHGGGSLHYGRAYLDHLILPAYSASTNPDIQWWPDSITQTIPQGSFSVDQLHISNWNSPAVTFLGYFPPSLQTIVDETFPTSGALPAGWTNTNELGSRPWTVATGGYSSQPPAAFDGAYNARFTALSTSAISRLSLPVQDLSWSTSAALRFHRTQVPYMVSGSGALGVYYKSSAGGTWTLLASYSDTATEWTREIITLPNLSSTYYISFVGSGMSSYTICLDKVMVQKRNYTDSSTTWAQFETGDYISATIGPMSFYTYNVMFSSIGLNPGTYTSEITITSNCTANPVITVPVTLNVYAAILDEPTNLILSYDAAAAGVRLDWDAPPGFPTGYKVYKAYREDFSDSVLIGTTEQTWFLDPVDFSMRRGLYRVVAVRD